MSNSIDHDTTRNVFKFDPGGYIICESKRFMFVVIAKNATTTLKRLVHSLDHPDDNPIQDTEQVHEFFGYTFANPARVPLRAGRRRPGLTGYTKFAVYRDPAERFLSVYFDKASPLRTPEKPVRRYFAACGMIDVDIDRFLAFTREELRKADPLHQDEHLRPQSAFYSSSDVDFIVPIEHLDRFLADQFDIETERRFNASGAAAGLSTAQTAVLRSMYASDYAILDADNVYA